MTETNWNDEYQDMLNQPAGPGYTLNGQPTRWADYYTTHPAHASAPYQDAPEAVETPAAQGGAKLEVRHDERNTGLALKGCCLFMAFAVVLVLAGCALAFPVTEMLPDNSPTSPYAPILATPVLQGKDAKVGTNGAFLMGENKAAAVSSPIPATAGPNLQATIDFWVREQIAVTEKARKDTMLIAKYTQDQQAIINAGAIATTKALPLAQTATVKAQSTDNAMRVASFTQSAEIREATQNAPDVQSKQQKADIEKQWGWVYPIAMIILSLVGVGFVVIGFMAMRRPHVETVQEAEPEHDPFPELRKLGRPIIQSGETSLDADTAPPGDPVRFAELLGYAVDDGPLGIGSVMASKIYTNHPEYIPVLEWLRKKDENRKRRTPPLPSLLQTLKSGKLCFTPAGVQWGKDWLYSHEIPPSPSQEVPQNSADNGHGHDDNGVIEAGGVVDIP